MRSLDEYTSEELVRELSKRHYRRMSANKCPYCEKKLSGDARLPGATCVCRFGICDGYHPPHILNSLQYGERHETEA